MLSKLAIKLRVVVERRAYADNYCVVHGSHPKIKNEQDTFVYERAVPVSHNHAVWAAQDKLLSILPSNLAIQRLSKC